MSELENNFKLAGLAFWNDYGPEYFKNEVDAIDFIKWNVNKGYMSLGFVETVAECQAKNKKFTLGDLPCFYGEWLELKDRP